MVGYWMPHEGTDNIAYALISFDSLANYEAYRTRLKADQEGKATLNLLKKSALFFQKNVPWCKFCGANVTSASAKILPCHSCADKHDARLRQKPWCKQTRAG